MIENACIIILDQPPEGVRQAVHDIVKENATDWWHHLSDVWIAGGLSAKEWRDMIMKKFPGQILVLPLPDDREERVWAASLRELMHSSDSMGGPFTWLTEVYSGRRRAMIGKERKVIAIEPASDNDPFSDEPPF
jgi:hypothetical protein